MQASKLLAAVVALAMVLASVAARAEPTYTDCKCMYNTPNPDKPLACDPETGIEGLDPAYIRCECFNECDGAAAAGGVNPAVAKGAVNFFGAIAFVLILSVAPGFAIRMINKGKGPMEDRATYNAKWRVVKEEIAGYERRGRAVEALRSGLVVAETAGLAEDEQLRDAAKERKSWRKSLKPTVDTTRCGPARARLRRGVTGWPVEKFGDWGTYCDTCPCEKPEQPVQLVECTPDHFACVNAPVCCPRTHPNYNACDQMCYRTQSYDGSKSFEAAACEVTESCKLPAPAP